MNTLPYTNRDVSWLSFNYRVLQEAKDPAVPLLERLKFLAIYSSNLDEFFRIRVAGIRKLKKVGKKTKAQLDFDPTVLVIFSSPARLKTYQRFFNTKRVFFYHETLS